MKNETGLSRNEAARLLEAWDFFEKYKEAASWEGMSRANFFLLITVITEKDDLLAARNYLENILTGEIEDETVPQKLIEKAEEPKKEGSEIEELRKKAEASTRRWIFDLEHKTPDNRDKLVVEAAESAAYAQKFLQEKEEEKEEENEEESFNEIPPGNFIPTPIVTPSIPVTRTAKVKTVSPSTQRTSAGISLVVSRRPGAVSLGAAIKRNTYRLAALPFNLTLNMGAKDLSEESPEEATSLVLLKNGITSAKIAPLKQQALAAGFSESQWERFAGNLSRVGATTRLRTFMGMPTLEDIAEIEFLNTDVSISRTQISNLFLVSSKDGSGMVLSQPSFVQGIFSQIGQSLFGKVAGKGLGKLLGIGAGKAVSAGAGVAATTTATAAAGSVVPVIGNIVGAIIGFVASTLGPGVFSFLNKHKEEIVGALLVGGGVLLGALGYGTVGLILGGIGGIAILGKAAGGTSGIGNAVSGFGGSLLYGITHVVFASIAIPLAIASITTILLVSFIYFMITTGSFVLPGGQGGALGPGAGLGKALPPPSKPADKLCLPASGTITQGAFCEEPVDDASHCSGNENAYDIGAGFGTPIYAAHEGRACSFAYDPYPVYGLYVTVDGTYNGQAVKTLYGHMISNFIPAGTCKQVSAGEIIGYVGSTGNSTGPHLHFGVISPSDQHIASIFGKVTVGENVQNCFNK